MDIPQGSIPVDQFEAASPEVSPLESQDQPPLGAIPVNQFQSEEQAYGTPTEMLKTGLEAAGRGLVGPLAPIIEKAAGVKPEAMRGRQSANPWTSGIGETVGLLAPLMVTGGASAGARAAAESGEALHEGASVLSTAAEYGTVVGAMTKAGEAATHALGLAAPTAYKAKVGSAIVRQAAEAAIYQLSDETSRVVSRDENAPVSVENAMANVGLAAAIGGAAGGVFAGAVNPLWEATIGPKVSQFLNATKYHFDADTGKVLQDYSGVTPAVEGSIRRTPDANIRNIAEEYAQMHGLKLNNDIPTVMADPDRATAIATAFDRAVHSPNDPKVRKAYNALAKETMEQWEAIKKTGLKAEPIPVDMPNPYKNSAEMIKDVRENNHMWYYPTSEGFGTGDHLPKHFSMLSAQVGEIPNPAAHDALKADLIKHGFKVSDAMGKYDGKTEPSLIIEHNGSAKAKEQLLLLAKKYGQESVLHSGGNPGTRLNTLAYTDGRPSVSGFGVEANPNATKDFTENPLYGKFNLKFDKEVPNTAHPLLTYTGETINGKPVQMNDIFRIVHDYFGHAKEGFGFGANGEENAWRHHMQMFTPDAQRALTSETRGQNSWVNYGPKGAANRANPSTTQYAEQKATLLPKWASDTTEKPVTPVLKSPLSVQQLSKKGFKKGLKEIGGTAKDLAMEQGIDDTYNSITDPDSTVHKALGLLGIDLAPVMKAAMNGHPKAIQIFNELREVQHPEVMAALQDLPARVDAAVASNLGTSLHEAAHYSESEAGHELLDTFTKEYNQRYQPVAEQLERRNANAAGLMIPDEARRDFGGQIVERGMRDVQTDSPYYKIYEDYAQRVMAKDDIAGLDKLKTELNNNIKSVSHDFNAKNAYRDIKTMIADFQENQIEKEGIMVGKEGVMNSADMIAQRKAANKSYTEFSRMSEDLADHVGAGNFRGAGTLKEKLGDVSPEQLLRKFSPRGNVDSIPFLQKYFPETLNRVQEIEAKKFLAPSVYQEKGMTALDIPKLNRTLEKTLKGSPEYARFVLPNGAPQKIQAAQAILDAIPGIKSSGTAGWLAKLTKHVPASALSAIGFMSGHNPVSGYLLGEVAQRLGRDVPDAIKLGYLKFLGSDKSVNAAGFQSMIDLLHNSIRGHAMLMRGAQNIFKTGGKVLVASQLPTIQDRTKLDKIVNKMQENPDQMTKVAQGQLGHYLPAHQQALAATSASQLQYLAGLKPRPMQAGPLDTPAQPSDIAMARYNRALDIANNPAIILEDIKDGTLRATDIQDIKAMYPSLYTQISQQLMNGMTNHKAEDGTIPYKTRMSISLFLGQPLDSTMTPMSIQAAQATYIKPQGPMNPQEQKQSKSHKGTSTLGKSNKSYRTTTQAAESDRGSRE